MALREGDSSTGGKRNDTSPASSATSMRASAAIFVNGRSKSADIVNWPKVPELEEFEAMADRIFVAGF